MQVSASPSQAHFHPLFLTLLLTLPAALQEATKAKAAKEAEDAYWASAGEGAKSKAAAKREAEEAKRLEQLARKAELKRLQEEEEAALSRPKANPKANRVSGPKVCFCAGMQDQCPTWLVSCLG